MKTYTTDFIRMPYRTAVVGDPSITGGQRMSLLRCAPDDRSRIQCRVEMPAGSGRSDPLYSPLAQVVITMFSSAH